jgi:hypothetical protein
MKKVIDGKLYNTETAHEIASDSQHPSDFRYRAETLYQTRKGAWFLYGQSVIQFSQVLGGQSFDAIIPLTAGKALDWLEQHASADIALAHFGTQVEEA